MFFDDLPLQSLVELAVVLLALGLALALQPWRLMRDGHLLTPILATWTLLPWFWAAPSLTKMPLPLQGSGACLVLLMLGWPLAVPVLLGVGIITSWVSPMSWQQALDSTIWLGLIPATLALSLGAVIRRWAGTHIFVYTLGRAFLGTALCMFVARTLALWTGHQLQGIDGHLSLIANLLLSWGDAFLTGMFSALLVAYKPEWLATWSDRLYLKSGQSY